MKKDINLPLNNLNLDTEVKPYKLINIDLLKKDIYLPLNNLNLDTATKLAFQNSQVSNELKTRFKKDL